MELFDQKVDRFLKKQMSDEEERAFKYELSGNPEKLARAKSIALAIKQMKNSAKDKDKEVAKSISEMDEKSFSDVVSGKYEIEFDERTSKFLKGKMGKEEEQLYFEEIKRSPEKLSRAKIIALAISQMKSHQKERDKEIMEAIQEMDLFTFKIIITLIIQGKEPSTIKTILKKYTQPRVAASIAARSEPAPKRPRYIFLKWTMGIAASVLIMFGVGFGFHQYDVYQTKKWGNEYGEFFYDMQMVSRGSATDSIVIHQLTSKFQNIQKGDSLSEATKFLAEVYSASFSGKYSAYKEYDIYITWNLAIAYLKQGNKKEAKIILKKLISEYADTPIGKKADELLQKIQ